MDAESLFQDALALAEHPDANFVKLGQRLVELRGRSPDRFQDFIKQSRLSRRKAYYLVTITEQLDELEKRGAKLDEAQLRRIGWTKLQVIASDLTPGNVAKQLRMAEQHTIRELAIRMRGDKPAPKEHAILLRFTPEQYQVFEEAILQNGGQRRPTGRGLLNKEEAIIKIMQQSDSPVRRRSRAHLEPPLAGEDPKGERPRTKLPRRQR
jgi:hypothetical protein